jgi:DNA-binding CsgD family transcriptional regulator
MPRHKIDIPEELVIAHARNGSPNSEIAAILGCSEATIRQRFSKALKKGRAERKALVRKLQLESAKKLNPALLIWLGKNELGQVDAPKDAQPKPAVLPSLRLIQVTGKNAAGNEAG